MDEVRIACPPGPAAFDGKADPKIVPLILEFHILGRPPRGLDFQRQ
jgi:hypothetical protein